ncbi:MAG: arylsulfatase [Opitutaceae bacterium]|nr:arylsulfatase [Opitutaceae bacterium]
MLTPQFRRWLLTAALALVAIALHAAADPRPNIVVVMTDDQDYGDLGIHGNPHIRTPNLDRFGREGVQLTRFYVAPVCAPTRASLLTGRYHYRTGILHTSRGGAKMHGDEATIAEFLRDAGYRTGIFGKWHLGDNIPMRPSDQGFAESLIHKSGGIDQGPDHPNSYFDPRLWHNNQPQKTSGYCTDVFFSAALQFIEQNRDQPFFVYLPTNAPHTPLQVSPRYSDRYKAMGLDDTTAKVYAMVENIDENFGRLMATLDRLDLRRNTVVVFLTDNGAQQSRFSAGQRGRKGTVYEGGIHVPCFWQWPARFDGRRTIDRVAAHIDLLPTLLEVAGVPPATGRPLDGRSLLPLLARPTPTERWPERTVFLQVHRGLEPKKYQHFAAVTQQFKLIGHPGTFNREDLDPAKVPPPLELYDLSSDPGEKNDLAAKHPEVVTRLRREYEAWFESVRRERQFLPGVIHIGSPAEPEAELSRYQDGGYPGGIKTGWRVKVLRGGIYDATFNRGVHGGAAQLVVSWQGKTSRVPLAAGKNQAALNLGAGEGILDIWLESPAGKRLDYEGNDSNGDPTLRWRG